MKKDFDLEKAFCVVLPIVTVAVMLWGIVELLNKSVVTSETTVCIIAIAAVVGIGAYYVDNIGGYLKNSFKNGFEEDAYIYVGMVSGIITICLVLPFGVVIGDNSIAFSTTYFVLGGFHIVVGGSSLLG